MPKHRASQAATAIERHHEAWSVETLGEDAGLDAETIEGLVRDGYLSPADVAGRRVPGMRHTVDPWLFAVLTGSVIAQADPKDLPAMRRWPLKRWKGAVDDLLDQRIREALAKGWLRDWFGRVKSGVRRLLRRPDKPAELTEAENANWRHTKHRAAQYVTGISDAARIQLRRLIESGSREGLTAQQLMLRLSARMRGYERDWLRVARTELQAAHSDAAAAEAVEMDGVGARVARVPEADACEHCKRLYLDAYGKPIIWDLADLAANGTNFGRKSPSWEATLYPLHPS